nr:uncharacterized protein LOC111764476 [Dasypus novemcinctus]
MRMESWDAVQRRADGAVAPSRASGRSTVPALSSSSRSSGSVLPPGRRARAAAQALGGSTNNFTETEHITQRSAQAGATLPQPAENTERRYRGLNLGPHTWEAGAQPLSCTCSPRVAFNSRPPTMAPNLPRRQRCLQPTCAAVRASSLHLDGARPHDRCGEQVSFSQGSSACGAPARELPSPRPGCRRWPAGSCGGREKSVSAKINRWHPVAPLLCFRS